MKQLTAFGDNSWIEVILWIAFKSLLLVRTRAEISSQFLACIVIGGKKKPTDAQAKFFEINIVLSLQKMFRKLKTEFAGSKKHCLVL